jgi:hypothetical protein
MSTELVEDWLETRLESRVGTEGTDPAELPLLMDMERMEGVCDETADIFRLWDMGGTGGGVPALSGSLGERSNSRDRIVGLGRSRSSMEYDLEDLTDRVVLDPWESREEDLAEYAGLLE